MFNRASQVLLVVKNLPINVARLRGGSVPRLGGSPGSLGWEDPLEEGIENHSSSLAWRIPMDKRAWQATVHGMAKT